MNGELNNECLAPLVHIGYAKAGSTSLQSVLGDPKSGFEPDRDICSRVPRRARNDRNIKEYLVQTHDFEFNHEQLRMIANEKLGWAKSSNRVPLISYERLAGHWITGGHDCKTIADRIRVTWPYARILIIFREQKSMLSSVFRQYIRKGGSRTFTQLLIPEGTGHSRGPGFSLRHFKYDQLVQYYQDIFGSDNVLALPLEMLMKDSSGFFERIFDFSGVQPENGMQISMPHMKLGIDAYTAGYKRLINPILAKDYVNGYSAWCTPGTKIIARMFMQVVRLLSTKKKRAAAALKLENEISRAVGDYYGVSNCNLEDLTGIRLEEYGYYLQKS